MALSWPIYAPWKLRAFKAAFRTLAFKAWKAIGWMLFLDSGNPKGDCEMRESAPLGHGISRSLTATGGQAWFDHCPRPLRECIAVHSFLCKVDFKNCVSS